MSPVIGPVSGTNFVFCSYGKFQLGYRAEISAVTERNKARLSKVHPGTKVKCFYGKMFSPVTEISVTWLARILI